MTKTQAVLDWLKTHASISSMEAIQSFGATRLSVIIFNIANTMGPASFMCYSDTHTRLGCWSQLRRV